MVFLLGHPFSLTRRHVGTERTAVTNNLKVWNWLWSWVMGRLWKNDLYARGDIRDDFGVESGETDEC